MDRSVGANNANDNNGNHDDEHELAAPLEPSMVCTAVAALGPKVCFATYNEEQNKIIIEESPSSGYDVAVIAERYLAFVRPNLLLIGSNFAANEGFLEAITKPLPDAFVEEGQESNSNSNNGNDAGASARQRRSIPYRLLRSGAFDHKRCLALIVEKLRVLSVLRQSQRRGGGMGMGEPRRMFPQHPSGTYGFRISNFHAIGSLVDLDSPLQVKCVGALLSFLESTIFKLEEGGTITINDIEHSKSSMYMNISASTISALHIFATEIHPLVMASGKGNSKEGTSLFSLLDRTRSRGGRQMLRNWMLKPLLDRDEILSRQDGVEFFCSHIDSDGHIGAILVLLQDIGSIHQILNRIKKSATLPMDFVTLARTLAAAREICRILQGDILQRLIMTVHEPPPPQEDPNGGDPSTNNSNHHPTERQLKASRYLTFLENVLDGCNVPQLDELYGKICTTVDEESTVEARDTIFIKPGFCEDLDRWKAQYSNLNEQLAVQRQSLLAKHPELGALAVVFVPQIGFLVGLEKQRVFDSITDERKMALPQDFEHVCNSENGYAYFKNADMHVLDRDIGDLDGIIKDTEALIVARLECDILEDETHLRNTFLALSELDCIIAFAEAAKDRNYIRPTLLDNHNGIVRIKNGRHPLQEILVEHSFIPNNTDMNPNARVNIVTGPNFSGKSCYARQVGILVYLAHIGCFLPCDAAQISIFDQIFAQFSAVETCAVPQSSFQLDLTQMGTILRRSTPKSLILVDEFGKGTSPASGIALLTAAIKKFSAIKCSVVCTTHFLEIFSLGLLRDGELGLKALQMAVHVPSDRADVAQPLFKLKEGVADSSAGIICAKMAGLHRDVIERAKEIVQALKDKKEITANKDVLRAISAKILTPAAKEAIRGFLKVQSWEDSTDEEIKDLLRKIAKL